MGGLRSWTAVTVGAVGGLVGALVMAVWILIYAVFAGPDAWRPFAVEGVSWFGPGAVAHHPAAAIFLGLIVYLLTLAVLGAIFAALAVVPLAGERPTRYAAWGFVYGAVIWLLLGAGELPAAHPLLSGTVAPWALAIGLALYGSFAGSYVGGSVGAARRAQR